MDELISKKTVLDAIDEISREVDDGDGFNYAKWREYFCELPSVHGTNMAEVDTDSIRRQQAIEAVQNRHMMLTKEKTLLINDLEKLPSAQPEPIRINLNEPIKVKLTDWGKEIYYHKYDRTNQIAGREICKPKFPKEDENGYTKFQLWCFMELYGEHMGMTMPNVIEPLEIVYERRTG